MSSEEENDIRSEPSSPIRVHKRVTSLFKSSDSDDDDMHANNNSSPKFSPPVPSSPPTFMFGATDASLSTSTTALPLFSFNMQPTKVSDVVSPTVSHQNVSPSPPSTLPPVIAPTWTLEQQMTVHAPPSSTTVLLSSTVPALPSFPTTICPLPSSATVPSQGPIIYGPMPLPLSPLSHITTTIGDSSSMSKSDSTVADLQNHSIEKIEQMMGLAHKLNDYLSQFLCIKLVPAEAQSHLVCLSSLRSQLDQYKSIADELCTYYSVVEGISNLEHACQAYYKGLTETVDKVALYINSNRVLVHDWQTNNIQLTDTLMTILKQLVNYLNKGM